MPHVSTHRVKTSDIIILVIKQKLVKTSLKKTEGRWSETVLHTNLKHLAPALRKTDVDSLTHNK